MNTVAFGDLFKFIRNGMNVRQDKSNNGLPITRIETISTSIVDPLRVGYAGISPGDADQWLLEDGDILFSHINSVEHVGKCAVYRKNPERLVHGMNLLCLRCKPDALIPDYAVHMIRSQEFRAKLLPFVNRAVNQASLSIGNLKKISVSIPPLEEQWRIARILNKVNTLQCRRREAIAFLDDLARAIFFDMFGDPVVNQMCWPQKNLGRFGRVTTGNTPPRSDESNYGSIIEWIKSDNIDPSRIHLTEAVERLSANGMKRARIVGAGSLLVTCIAGSPTSIGNIAIANRDVAFNQQINALTPHGSDARFLYAQLRIAKRLIQDKSTGGMKGLVSKSRFESIDLIDPPIDMQLAFSEKAKMVDSLKELHQVQLAKLDALFASLQYRALRGELCEVPAT